MEAMIQGNSVRITLTEADDDIVVTLPDGYSYESLVVTGALNINYIAPFCKSVRGAIYRFPPVRSKSPSTMRILKENASAAASIVLTITKFGQIPDAHYFDAAFEPILVTGDDGNEYPVIPSDQFK